MALYPSEPRRCTEKSSRRLWMSELAGLLLSAGGFGGAPLSWTSLQAASPVPRSLSIGASDLYAIFKEEIAAGYHDNVYRTLGNQLQLDGASYIEVSRA